MTSGAPLDVVLRLVRRLDEAGVRWCHWKSNEHVLAGMQGKTDLDILVDRAAKDEFAKVARGLGFKFAPAVRTRRYPHVDDWLGLDPSTGALVHLHTHYELVLGEPDLKGYLLPWSKEILDRRIPGPHGIPVSDPVMEFVLLSVRRALKLKGRREDRAVRQDAGVEQDWLLARMGDPAGRTAATELAVRLLGPSAQAPLQRLFVPQPSATDLVAWRRAIQPRLSRFRRLGWLRAKAARAVRILARRLGKLNRRRLHLPIPSYRTLPEGRTVVLLGSDGSGKSTVRRDLVRWLGWKLDVHEAYFGSGDRRPSLLRRVVGKPKGGAASGGRKPSLAHATLMAVRAYAIVRERRAVQRRVRKARRRGMVVVGDRFPQAQVPNALDGPKLGRLLAFGGVRAAMARAELRAYRRLFEPAPDLVIKLDVAAATIVARRPEHTPEQAEDKRRVALAINFPATTTVVLVDANQPLESVVLEARRAVWEALP